MFLLLLKKIQHLYKRSEWFTIITVLLLLHVISTALLLYFDYPIFARETVIETLWRGTWFFFVTATTVGYGDIVPQSIPGQVVAIFDMVFGIGLMATAIGAGAENLFKRRKMRVRGLSQLKMKNHIVILGGGAKAKLETLIKEIRYDPSYCHTEMVVCSDAYEENPSSSDIEFVRGGICSEDVLRRACVKDADFLIIYGYTDEESILTTLAVDELNRAAFTTVYIRDRANIRHIDRINKARVTDRCHRIHVITRLADLMLAREIANPDLSNALLSLMDGKTGSTVYSINAWPSLERRIKVATVWKMLRSSNGRALLVGIKRDEDGSILMNPDKEVEVCPNDNLFVIADHRPDVDWISLIPEDGK
jgi:voltage-gated potassium channel